MRRKPWCRLPRGVRSDDEAAGETHVTGIWEGADAAYRGPAVPVPSRFRGMVQRKVGHFEILLGLLKMMVDDVLAHRSTSEQWLAKAKWAIARGEAILSGADDVDQPSCPPGSSNESDGDRSSSFERRDDDV
ncbi:hypothetical protein [Phyllobacterium zundukense]|uniref:Uncharacterized protein n=1 Tax=Phyllobacterium zundukense TaxID=1867719 RepID=A0ACD4CW31_9HYPH|nr:hypothetical protein [Phyllobacterium zundukense]UXN57764.1 hypothetical protein N8E88_02865 [Phyllobacterium zundukense]